MWIPQEEWNQLSVDQRLALTDYLESKIPEIRRNSEAYVGVPKNAPAYERIRRNIAALADGRYIIFTMVHQNGEWLQKDTVAQRK